MANQTPIRIYLSPPHLSGREKDMVAEAIDSNWIAPLGPHVDAFEKELTAYTKAIDCAALSTGTAALHLALIQSGVGPGDVVLCPTLTFSASANPIVYQGAQPIFIDCTPDTWNIDPQLCAEAIKDCIKKGIHPKAIIVVHLYGMPAQMDALMELSRTYAIPLIEDAAESLGSTFNEQHTGTFSRFGVMSFNGNKIITTSGGGALLCNDAKDAHYTRFLATQARDAAPHYQHSVIGYNYRLSNICAAVGRGQLTVLPERIAARRRIYATYCDAFASVEGINTSIEKANMFSNRWLSTFCFDPEKTGANRETIRLALADRGIESRPIWKPMHQQPVFSDTTVYSSGTADNIFNNGLCLPSGSALTASEQEEIISTVLDTLR